MPAIYNQFNYNQCNYNSSFCLFDQVINTATIISKDLVKINFAVDVLTVPSVYVVANYTVSGVGVSNPEVFEVVTPSSREVSYILVGLRGSEIGGVYQLTVASGTLFTASGDRLPEQSIDFTLHRTKLDLVLTSVPRFYSTKSGSIFRSILEAVMISDEEIGGDF